MQQTFTVNGTSAKLLAKAMDSEHPHLINPIFEYCRGSATVHCASHYVDSKLDYRIDDIKVLSVELDGYPSHYTVTVETAMNLNEYAIEPVFIHTQRETVLLRFNLIKK